MIIVDTNVVAELMKPSPDPAVVSWLNDQDSAALFLTTITIGEIGFGLEILPQGKRRLHLEQGFERGQIQTQNERLQQPGHAHAKAYPAPDSESSKPDGSREWRPRPPAIQQFGPPPYRSGEERSVRRHQYE